MKFCSKCGKEIMEEAVICVHCGCAVEGSNKSNNSNIGLFILSALIPIFGVIYWPLKHKENAQTAMTCGIIGICSWLVWGILFAVLPNIL